jgi:aryl-alcohol dehydrogenase-like predicted oxidoreductase
MQYRELGNSGIIISDIIMGTWQAGKKMWVGIDDTQTTVAIRAALDFGITTFDTAEEYGHGHSERILGKALKDVRDKVVIASKVHPSHLEQASLMEACHRSLKNLSTDYIDLYQIHWPSGSWGTKIVPVEKSMEALIRLKEQGKIRAVGVSNFSALQVEDTLACGPVASVQPPYSLFWRQAEKKLIPFCRSRGITILAYSALAQGTLTGKFGPDHVFAKGDHRRRNRLFAPENRKKVKQALDLLLPMAESKNVSPARLALSWVIHQEGVCAVAGARNASQVSDNAQAADLVLSGHDLQELDHISAIVTENLDDDPVQWR